MSDKRIDAVYSGMRLRQWQVIPADLEVAMRCKYIAQRKVTSRRWPDGRVMYKRIK